MQNLQSLSVLTWLIALTVIAVLTLTLWWLHRNFELAEIELPFKNNNCICHSLCSTTIQSGTTTSQHRL